MHIGEQDIMLLIVQQWGSGMGKHHVLLLIQDMLLPHPLRSSSWVKGCESSSSFTHGGSGSRAAFPSPGPCCCQSDAWVTEWSWDATEAGVKGDWGSKGVHVEQLGPAVRLPSTCVVREKFMIFHLSNLIIGR